MNRARDRNIDELAYLCFSRDQLGLSLAEYQAGKATSTSHSRSSLPPRNPPLTSSSPTRPQKRARQAAALAAETPVADYGATANTTLDADDDVIVPSKKLDDEEASIADSIEAADKARQKNATTPPTEYEERAGLPAMSCIGRIGRPMFKLINRPWKVRSLGG